MELNKGGIIASSNVHTKSPLEPDGDNQTQVYGIWSRTHMEFVHHPMYLPKNVQHPIHIDNYIILFPK